MSHKKNMRNANLPAEKIRTFLKVQKLAIIFSVAGIVLVAAVLVAGLFLLRETDTQPDLTQAHEPRSEELSQNYDTNENNETEISNVLSQNYDTNEINETELNNELSQNETPQIEEPEIMYEPELEPPPEPVIHTARLAFVGDVMCHIEQLNAARVSEGVYDFHYKFRYIAPYIRSADFAIANLETTLVHERFRGWPLFRSPRSLAEALLYAGFHYVTTGNNHSFDAGVAGVRSTIEILNDVGLGFTGTFLTPECRYIPTIVEVNGFTFALLSVTMHTNAIDLGFYNYMMKIVYHDLVEQSQIDYEMIESAIARARALEPDFVIVLPHIGIEYYGTMDRRGGGHQWDTFDRRDTRWVNWMRTMQFFLEAGADIVMNHHPHTLLPAEFVYFTDPCGNVRRTFMAYSMANFVSAQRTQPRETSAVFYIDFERIDGGSAKIVGASYVPIWVRQHDPTRTGLDFTILPVTENLRRAETGDHADLRPQDIARLREVHRDVTHMLSGEPIPLEYMDYEYAITRSRTCEEFPGLPLWGTLPWR